MVAAPVCFPERRRDDDVQALPDRFLSRVTKQAHRSRVPLLDHPSPVGKDQGIRRLFHQYACQFSAHCFAQRTDAARRMRTSLSTLAPLSSVALDENINVTSAA